MEYRAMKKIGMTPSLLGFGAMRMPMENKKVDIKEARRIIDYLYKNGVNYYDTAYFYHDGESENVLGEALSAYPRDSFYVATKLPVGLCKSLDDAKRIFDLQLTRLNMDYVDLYMLHGINLEAFCQAQSMDILPWMETLKAEGKIRSIGFSFHGSYEDFEQILNAYDWDFVQIQLSYLDLEHQQGIKGYKLLETKGIPAIIMEPLRGGALARLSPEHEERLKSLDQSLSVASWAFRWCAELPGIKVILSGMSTYEQAEDNIKTFGNYRPFTIEEKDTVNEVAEAVRLRPRVGCTACNYCSPCPMGVDIPGCFDAYNSLIAVAHWEYSTKYNKIPEEAKAHICTTCGTCLEKCPQKLPIPELMRKFLEEQQRFNA